MTLTKIKPDDPCMGCGASAKFHLQNPFGVRRSNSEFFPEYYGWNNVPRRNPVSVCNEYVLLDGRHVDHDVLYMMIS
jgi:hypothetical protein